MSNEYHTHDPDHTENRKLFEEGAAYFGEEAERAHWECAIACELRTEENPRWAKLDNDGPRWFPDLAYRRRVDAPAIPGNKRFMNAHDPDHIANRKLFAAGAEALGEEAEHENWECIRAYELRAEKHPRWKKLGRKGPHWYSDTVYRRRADAPTISQKGPIDVEIEIEIDHTSNRILFAHGVAAFGEEAERKNWECVQAYKLRTENHPHWTQVGPNGPNWFSEIAYRRRADAPAILDTASVRKIEDQHSPEPEPETTPNWKIEAWDFLSHHPFFEGCEDDVGDRKGSLVEVMFGRLDRASEGFVTLAPKYADTLSPFVNRMVRELYATGGEDVRDEWRGSSARDLMLELHLRVGKMQKAAFTDKSTDQIFEYAADVANLAMMVADVSGSLGEPESTEAKSTSDSGHPATRSSVYYALAAAHNRGVKEADILCVLRSFVSGRLLSPVGYVNHLRPEHFAEVTKYLNAL